MKIIKHGIIACILLTTLAFNISDKPFKKRLLEVGESISFTNKPKSANEVSSSSMQKGSYDGSGFELSVDTGKHILIKNITQPFGPKQDELTVIGCTGTLTRTKENVVFTFEKCRNKYYLIDLNNSKVIDSFDLVLQLSLSSSDINGNPGEFYCSEKLKSGEYIRQTSSNANAFEEQTNNVFNLTSINLVSVPTDMKHDDLFKEVHKENTLAHFSNMELITTNNRKVNLPSGSYILCEGSSINLK